MRRHFEPLEHPAPVATDIFVVIYRREPHGLITLRHRCGLQQVPLPGGTIGIHQMWIADTWRWHQPTKLGTTLLYS